MTPALPTSVFVYGTLMPGERNEQVGRGAVLSSAASLGGYRLLHLHPEGYPGIVPGAAAETVRGVVLSYDPHDWARVLPALDRLEGVAERPPLYTREQVTVTLEGGLQMRVWTYVYADRARLTRPGVQPVPGGDWRTVPERREPGADGR